MPLKVQGKPPLVSDQLSVSANEASDMDLAVTDYETASSDFENIQQVINVMNFLPWPVIKYVLSMNPMKSAGVKMFARNTIKNSLKELYLMEIPFQHSFKTLLPQI